MKEKPAGTDKPVWNGDASTSRRSFMAASAAGMALIPSSSLSTEPKSFCPVQTGAGPVVSISSGNGKRATAKAYAMILEGSDALDAVVAGVNIVEADPKDRTVGYGGLPNEDGVVQLDAAVMHGPSHQAGAVACIEGIKLPSLVAKLVMERTDHVLLVGRGATEFAKAHGFKEEDLLTDGARQAWLRWKETASDKDDWLAPADKQKTGSVQRSALDQEIASIIRDRPTGTIHCSGISANGDISCVTTTSGLAFKIPGRVGDSPIIGAGLYVDNEIGSCGSTGRGEANLQNQCCSNAVELMRQGMTPKEAGLEVLRRVAKHTVPRLRDENGNPDFGLNFYLLRKDGMHAGVTLRRKSKYSVTDKDGTRHEDCVSLLG